jgi:uncharacterized membrane protein YhaH (DUF805 family)
MMRSYFDGLLRYFEFSGRSTRMQYWMFSLVTLIIAIGAAFGDSYLSGIPVTSAQTGPLTIFVALFHAIPAITLTVRRLHDIGRSGWWYWIGLIPLVGAIILLVWMCWPSEEHANDHGERPHGGSRSAPQRESVPYSTIPRQVRMGTNGTRPQKAYEGLSAPQRFI